MRLGKSLLLQHDGSERARGNDNPEYQRAFGLQHLHIIEPNEAAATLEHRPDTDDRVVHVQNPDDYRYVRNRKRFHRGLVGGV